MGRAPCCEKETVKRGPWTPDEDAKLLACIAHHGTGSWRTVPKKAGLQRCGKSCRLRWTNYLRPDLKHGRFSDHEEQTIVRLHAALGSRWSLIAAQLPGRTDNDVKNYWNTRLKKKLCEMGIDPITHKPISQLLADLAGSMAPEPPPQQPPPPPPPQPPRSHIADVALSCFKDDMLNVLMRRHPPTLTLLDHDAATAAASSAAFLPIDQSRHIPTFHRQFLWPHLQQPQQSDVFDDVDDPEVDEGDSHGLGRRLLSNRQPRFVHLGSRSWVPNDGSSQLHMVTSMPFTSASTISSNSHNHCHSQQQNGGTSTSSSNCSSTTIINLPTGEYDSVRQQCTAASTSGILAAAAINHASHPLVHVSPSVDYISPTLISPTANIEEDEVDEIDPGDGDSVNDGLWDLADLL